MRINEVDGILLIKNDDEPPIMVDSNFGVLKRHKAVSKEKKRHNEMRIHMKEFNQGLKRKRIREKRIERRKIIKKDILSETIAAIVGHPFG